MAPESASFDPSDSFASAASGTMPMPERAPAAETAAPTGMWAVVFAGGIGSRFWPLSTPERPKQLLALLSGRSLLADTVGRFHPLIPPERVLIVTSHDIAPAIRAAVPGIPWENILVEPRPLGTAAALAWGAHTVVRRAGPQTPVCAMHADLAIGFPDIFRAAVLRAASVALREKAIVSFGVRPSRPEPFFGYVEPGEPLDAGAPAGESDTFQVDAFREKPSTPEAEALCARGALWHSGILVGAASTLLQKLRTYASEIAPGLDALRSDDLQGFIGAIGPVSIERGLLERIRRFIVMVADFGWDDVGTWASLRRARELDDDGNGAIGDVQFVDSRCNVVHGEAGAVVLFGVEHLLVVSLPGLTFVTSLERASDLKPLLDALPGSMRINPTGRGNR